MNRRKWLLIAAFLIYLGIPSVALAQARLSVPNLAPRNDVEFRTVFKTEPRPAARATVFNLAPRNDVEFRTVFKTEPRPAQIVAMQRTQRRLDQLNSQVLRLDPRARSMRIEDSVRQAPEKTIVVVGHQVNGNILFPDGRSQSLVTIESLIREQNKQAIFLSCDAQDYVKQSPGPKGTLAYRDVPRIIKSIDRGLGRNPSILQGSLSFDGMTMAQSAIDTTQLVSSLIPAAKITSVIGGVGGGGYVVHRLTKKRK